MDTSARKGKLPKSTKIKRSMFATDAAYEQAVIWSTTMTQAQKDYVYAKLDAKANKPVAPRDEKRKALTKNTERLARMDRAKLINCIIYGAHQEEKNKGTLFQVEHTGEMKVVYPDQIKHGVTYRNGLVRFETNAATAAHIYG